MLKKRLKLLNKNFSLKTSKFFQIIAIDRNT